MSPLPTVSRHSTKATLSCSRLESAQDEIVSIRRYGNTQHETERASTCVVQVVLQPAFGTLVVELPSTGYKKKQVVPERNTGAISLRGT